MGGQDVDFIKCKPGTRLSSAYPKFLVSNYCVSQSFDQQYGTWKRWT